VSYLPVSRELMVVGISQR